MGKSPQKLIILLSPGLKAGAIYNEGLVPGGEM
jgi:hypothetical protein